MTSRYLIYALTDPRTNLVRYIGKSTTGLKRPRFCATPSRLARERTHKANWIRGLISSGLRFGVDVLEEFERASDLDWAEKYWIAQARSLGWPLTNLTDGGEGAGHPVSPETRAKIAAANVGKSVSAETRAKIGAATRGRRASNETRLRISMALIGRSPSAETRAKLSLRNKGKVIPDETRARIAASRVGMRLSEAHKKAIGEASRGHVLGQAGREKVRKAALERWARYRAERGAQCRAY